ncbi:DUF3139 domain-containing protein [Paenibacillus popilliae]|uniref:Predicted transcriptional regulator n=1 Tax=Paenibacillus popilliae ATCC 14706 TaxID=1212764 RepID=M9M1P8_PAEPP|nr:DUF3139 domain-containing protein [Paenibacillus popilliae]GAC42859.1 predicted transcriptional regulator [Paenibacillus popilliae ATCC 14706]
MNTKRKMFYGILIALVLIILIPILKIKWTMYSLEKNLHDYLIHTQKYKEEEILSIKCVLSDLPKYPVYVRFKDKPNYHHVYFFRGNSWTQL